MPDSLIVLAFISALVVAARLFLRAQVRPPIPPDTDGEFHRRKRPARPPSGRDRQLDELTDRDPFNARETKQK